MKYLIDPKDGKPSVSLTMMVVGLVLIIASGVAQVLGAISSLGPFPELFYSSVALYFGRRFSIAGKTYESSEPEKENT